MPDLPIVTASVGNDATQKALEQADQALLNLKRSEIKLAEARVRRLQEKAQVSASGMTTSAFTQQEMSGGVFPFQEYQDIHSALGAHHANTPRDDYRNRSVEAANAVADADKAAEEEAAASSTRMFTGAIGIATMTVGAFVASVKSVNDAQSNASISINDQRIRRAQAMRDLGYSPAEVSARQERAESGRALPGGNSAIQEIQLLEAAAAAKSSQYLPAGAVDRRGLDKIIDSSLSTAQKMAIMGNPMIPGVMAQLRTQGQTDLQDMGMHALIQEARLSGMTNGANADAAATGYETRRIKNTLDTKLTQGGLRGHLEGLIRFIPGGETLEIEDRRANEQLALKCLIGIHNETKKSNNVPPSTDPYK